MPLWNNNGHVSIAMLLIANGADSDEVATVFD
jgi:hypothetical protein